MIFIRSLQRELSYTAGAVLLVLLTIMLAAMMTRIVGYAAVGQADPADVLILIGLRVVSYLAIMLVATLFIAVMIVLSRWYKDAEMSVWFVSGVGLNGFIKPIAFFAVPLIILIALFSIFAWPWANMQQYELTQRFKQRDEIALIAPGQFRESVSNQRVFFVEEVTSSPQRLRNIFIAKTKESGFEIIVAKEGFAQTAFSGDRYVVLENGRLYEGDPGITQYKVASFHQYGVRIDEAIPTAHRTTKGLTTLELLNSADNEHRAELAWRIGLPLMAIVLTIFAIPLSFQNPRHGRSINFVVAVLAFTTYSNLLSLLQAKIGQGDISLLAGTFLLHGTIAAIAIIFFWRRMRNRPFFRLIFQPLFNRFFKPVNRVNTKTEKSDAAL